MSEVNSKPIKNYSDFKSYDKYMIFYTILNANVNICWHKHF